MSQVSVPVSVGGEESVIQPGRQVSEYEFPPELRGELQFDSKPRYHGSFSSVYQGVLKREGHEPMIVAVKSVRKPDWAADDPKRFERRIKRETVIWSTAHHPNILPFIGHQIDPDAAMLVSPWCQNGNLTQYIRRNSHLTRSDKVKLLADSARGLEYLHSMEPPIIHGDIKPDNALVQDNLEAALCDFGLSRVQMALGEHSGLTTSERTSGTIGYMPKEIMIGEENPTPSSDVYAFGGLTLVAMSGKPPFWEMPHTATKILAVAQGQTPSPQNHPDLPSDDPLWELLSKCWRGDRDTRPPMSEVLEAVSLTTRNPPNL
ncbi:hypothetical protein FRB90_012838 [Tulasnella sp. 427]|nr:hypothetical protein FRB90_012838 [Tulasnella sp. 427]